VRINLKTNLQNALNWKVLQLQVWRRQRCEPHLRGSRILALKAKVAFLRRGDTRARRPGPRYPTLGWGHRPKRAPGAAAADGAVTAEYLRLNVKICGDCGGGGAHGGGDPRGAHRSPPLPPRKSSGPWPPPPNAPTPKAKC
jgi:hypothetical protein